MKAREEYQQKLQAQLDEWKAEIDKLKARAELAKADARVAYLKQVEILELKKQAMADKLDALQQESGSAWEDIRNGVESAWDELAAAIKKARSEFK
jgi:hypothetical protein